MIDPKEIFQEYELGNESDFAVLPSLVTVQDQDYFLTKGNDGSYRLLSTRCPHRWGEIIEWDICFMCPDHGWRFEKSVQIEFLFTDMSSFRSDIYLPQLPHS